MEIASPKDWETAKEKLNWLHDAVTRSLLFVNDQKVLADGSMDMGAGDAALKSIIQTQSRERPGGQITFHGVHSVTYDRERDVQPGEVTVVKLRGVSLLRFAFGECEVLARSATLTPMDWQATESATPAI